MYIARHCILMKPVILVPPDAPISMTLDTPVANFWEPVKLTCEIEDWFKNGELFQSSAAYYTSFVPDHVNDSGDYSCYSTNFSKNFAPMTSARSPSTRLTVNGKCLYGL